jgi:SPP1 gp7 family putative phage head morphogenesis protein
LTIKLTKKRQKWVKNRNVVLKGTALRYNAAQQTRYVNALERLVKQMTVTTKSQIMKLFKGEISKDFFKQQEQASAMDISLGSQAKILMNGLLSTFRQLFSKRANILAPRMVNGAEQTSTTSLHSSLGELTAGLSLKTSVVPKGLEDVATAIIAENVSLIKSIPEEYFNQVTGSVMRSITTGRGLADLVPEIQKYEGMTHRRARNIALDQTRKAYNSIGKLKMQRLGVKQFQWIHSGGGQFPRESHVKISGQIFSFENVEKEQAALGVPEADRGIPGYPVNCRCVMKPVIVFDSD